MLAPAFIVEEQAGFNHIYRVAPGEAMEDPARAAQCRPVTFPSRSPRRRVGTALETPGMATPGLRSRRLALRLLRPEDAERFTSLLGEDRDAVLQMSHMPYPCTLESAREWIALRTQPGATTFAIIRVGDGAFLGAIGFGGLPEMPGVGYWIGRPYWNQGYATEALRLIIDYARGLGAKGLQAETFPENPASARVLDKCGFQDRGIGLRDYPARGGMRRVHVHILHFATPAAAL